jgi:hypothetical protein
VKFKTRIAMESSPGFDMDAALSPVGVNALVRGKCKAAIDSIAVTVGDIPVRLAIPFLKQRKPPILASIGRFKITLSPIRLTAEGMEFELDGVIGTKGINAGIKGKVDCKTEMMMDGNLVGRVGTMSIEFDGEEPLEPWHEPEHHHEDERHEPRHEPEHHHKDERHEPRHEPEHHHEDERHEPWHRPALSHGEESA